MDFPRTTRIGSLLQKTQQLCHLSLMAKRTQSFSHRRYRLAERFGTPAHLML